MSSELREFYLDSPFFHLVLRDLHFDLPDLSADLRHLRVYPDTMEREFRGLKGGVIPVSRCAHRWPCLLRGKYALVKDR